MTSPYPTPQAQSLADGYYWVKDCGSLKIAKFTAGIGWVFMGSTAIYSTFYSEHATYIFIQPPGKV